MSAPSPSVDADGAAAGAGVRARKAVIPSAECELVMDTLTAAFRSTLSLPVSASAASSEVTYPINEKSGVAKASRDFDHKEKATIALAYPGEINAEQMQAIEDATNLLLKRQEAGSILPFKFIKPKRTKAKDGYELTFVIGATAKTLEAKTAAEKEKINSKKVGAGVVAAAAGDAPVVAAASAAASSSAAAASSSSAAAAAPAVAVASTDYVRQTTHEVFHELALASFAKLQLIQSSSTSNASAIEVAALLKPDQLAALLTKDQLKSKPAPADVLGFLGIERIISMLSLQQLESTLTPAQQAFFAKDMLPSLESYMIMFANEAYTRGFTAAKKGNGGINIAQLL